MPAHIKIIQAHEFIKATPEGQLDHESSKRLLLEIASVAAPFDEYEILLDTRTAHSEMSLTDLRSLADELGKFLRPLPRKTAVLCPPARFNLAEFFALCSQNHGLRINAFTSFEEAMDWLITKPDNPLMTEEPSPETGAG
jgi:hypothetical protein